LVRRVGKILEKSWHPLSASAPGSLNVSMGNSPPKLSTSPTRVSPLRGSFDEENNRSFLAIGFQKVRDIMAETLQNAAEYVLMVYISNF
jgi:hypothetical protein